jgi:stringent starvation protein B
MTLPIVKGATSDLEISFECDRHAQGPGVSTDMPPAQMAGINLYAREAGDGAFTSAHG